MIVVDPKSNEYHAAAKAGQATFEAKGRKAKGKNRTAGPSGGNKTEGSGNGTPRYNYNENIGVLMAALFNAAAGLYQAITQDSLRVQNEELEKLTKEEQNISNEIAADQKKLNGDKTGSKAAKDEQVLIDQLKGQLPIVQAEVQKTNTTESTMISAGTTIVGVLNSVVKTIKQSIDSITPNI